MRLPISLLCFAMATFLGGCAYQGVVVSKNAEPSPFYHSVGIDGSYSFMLRDSAGAVRRQLVTPDAYALYEVGDYFNDLEPRREGDAGSKNVRTAAVASRPQPKPAMTAAAVRKPAVTRRVATARKTPATAAKTSSRTATKSRSTATARKKTTGRVAAKSKKNAVKTAQRGVRRSAKPVAKAKAKPAPDKPVVELMVNVPGR